MAYPAGYTRDSRGRWRFKGKFSKAPRLPRMPRGTPAGYTIDAAGRWRYKGKYSKPPEPKARRPAGAPEGYTKDAAGRWRFKGKFSKPPPPPPPKPEPKPPAKPKRRTLRQRQGDALARIRGHLDTETLIEWKQESTRSKKQIESEASMFWDQIATFTPKESTDYTALLLALESIQEDRKIEEPYENYLMFMRVYITDETGAPMEWNVAGQESWPLAMTEIVNRLSGDEGWAAKYTKSSVNMIEFFTKRRKKIKKKFETPEDRKKREARESWKKSRKGRES